MNYYYLDEKDREIGPVSFENLRAFRASDVIKDHTLVRSEAGGPWTACVALIGQTEAPGSSKPQTEAAKIMSNTFTDARSALAFLATNPVGGLASAYGKLGPKQAGAVGIFFMVIFGLVLSLVLSRSLETAARKLGAVSGLGGGGFNIGQVSLMKLFLGAVGSMLGVAAVLGLSRLISQRSGRWEGDAFIAGAISLVWSAGLLITALVGWTNLEVCALVFLAAICITVLQIFVGLTRISGLSEPRATAGVPLVLVAWAWLTKIIATAIYV